MLSVNTVDGIGFADSLKKRRVMSMTKKKKTVQLRIPKSFSELTALLEEFEPLMKQLRYVFLTIVILYVIGMKDVITAMEFDSSLSGMLIWILMVLMLIGGFK